MGTDRAHRGASSRATSTPPDGSLSGGVGEAAAGVADGFDPRSGDPSSAVASPPHLIVADEPAALPGLDGPGVGRQVSALETAVRSTLRALAAEDALTPADAGRVALAIELAQIITDKRASKRTSTVGNDARVLMDILDELAPAAASETDKQLRAAMDSWSAKIAQHEAAGRGRAEVRDPA